MRTPHFRLARRHVSAALLSGLLIATAPPANAAPGDLPPAPPPEALPHCMQQLQPRAEKAGVPAKRFRELTDGLQADVSVMAAAENQPEFKTPIWDYLAGLADDQRAADGQAMMAQWRTVLDAVAQRYGVPVETVVAVWGVESDFGRGLGMRSLVSSLATVACFGKRQSYFSGEFIALLTLLERGDVKPDQAYGSWAGAFGHTQFMPSTYQRLAVDFDGDGRRDLVGSVPDALASAAHYLQKAGWKPGRAWGHEVQLPAGFDASVSGRKAKRPGSAWAAQGVKRVDGKPIDGDTPVGLLLPAGPQGPAFLVTSNFDAIYSYNAAESYALAIAHLSDRLRGAGPFATPWPTDDAGLSRAQRREVQTLLVARGHAIGEIDGMLGTASRAAIQAEQRRLGWPADGRAGQKLLRALKAGG